MSFKFTKLDIPDILYVQPQVFSDSRGSFRELYKADDYKDKGITGPFLQMDCSESKKNVLRGLHYQNPPFAQGKLLTVIVGEIYDVVVDIRKGSPYFRKSVEIILNDEKKNMIYIPPGFAHGFKVMGERAVVLYYCTNVYAPKKDKGIIWDDPALGIQWPGDNHILSEKDLALPVLEDAQNDFVYES